MTTSKLWAEPAFIDHELSLQRELRRGGWTGRSLPETLWLGAEHGGLSTWASRSGAVGFDGWIRGVEAFGEASQALVVELDGEGAFATLPALLEACPRAAFLPILRGEHGAGRSIPPPRAWTLLLESTRVRTHDRIRGEGTLARVLEFLGEIPESWPRGVLRVPATRENLERLDALLLFASRRSFRRLELHPGGVGTSEDPSLEVPARSEILAAIAGERARAEGVGLALGLAGAEAPGSLPSPFRLPAPRCDSLGRTLRVDRSGAAWACGGGPEGKLKIAAAGEDLLRAWSGPRMGELVAADGTHDPLAHPCGACPSFRESSAN